MGGAGLCVCVWRSKKSIEVSSRDPTYVSEDKGTTAPLRPCGVRFTSASSLNRLLGFHGRHWSETLFPSYSFGSDLLTWRELEVFLEVGVVRGTGGIRGLNLQLLPSRPFSSLPRGFVFGGGD